MSENEEILYLYLAVSPEKDDEVLTLQTVTTPLSERCSICFRSSNESTDGTDIEDEEEEESVSDTLFLIHRYCKLWISKDENEDNGHSVCTHRFHTLCLYKWIKSSKKFQCPNCRQGCTHRLEEIPELFPSPPEEILQYWHNGRVKCEYVKINNKIDGWYKTYDPDGHPMQETLFDNGLKNGMDIVYHSNLSLKKTTQVFENNVAHGPFKEFDKDGESIMLAGNFHQGLKHGKWIEENDIKGFCKKSIEDLAEARAKGLVA